MVLLPVAHRELLVAAQRRVTFRIRSGAAFLAAFVVFLLLVSGRLADPRAGGHQLFGVLNTYAVVLAGMAGLFLTADSISGERRSGTLGLLFLTDLSGFDILAGKLAASGLHAATTLLAVVPVIAFSWTLGGVTRAELVLSAVALLNLLWCSLTTGLWVSSRRSGAATTLMETGLWLGLGMLALPSATLPASVEFLRILSPATPWIEASGMAGGFHLDRYASSLIVSHLVGWGWLCLGARGLKSTRTATEHRKTHSYILWTRGGVPDDANPVMWVMQPIRLVRRTCWVLALLGAGIVITRWIEATFHGRSLYDPLRDIRFGPIELPQGPAHEIVVPVILLLTVFKLIFAWHCCRSAAELREGGLELLLSTPLRAMEVPRGIWHAGERGLLHPAAFLGFVQLLVTVLAALTSPGGVGWVGLFAAGYSLVVTALDFATIAWWATCFGLRDGRPAVAFGKTIAVVLAWRSLIWFVPDLLITLFLLEWGRLRVLAHLREVRADDAEPPPPGLWSPTRG